MVGFAIEEPNWQQRHFDAGKISIMLSKGVGFITAGIAMGVFLCLQTESHHKMCMKHQIYQL
jgi:hypothetical protein